MKAPTAPEELPEWPALLALVGEVIASLRGRHPGIVAEAVVDRITESYRLEPRETHHRERRRNHPERIRRLTHGVYRLLADPERAAPEREIAAGVLQAFILSPLCPRAGGGEG